MRLADLVARYLIRIDAPRARGPRPARSQDGATPPAPPDRLRKAATTLQLSPLITDWPEEWREIFEERAGIMEFDAGLARPDAESRAAHWTRRLHL